MTKTNRYTRLSLSEREIILRRRAEDVSLRSIARELNRSPSTISRELKRHESYHTSGYCQDCAHRDAKAAMSSRRAGKTKIGSNTRLRTYIHTKLRLRWSPEQIAARLKHEYPQDMSMHISHESIYRYLYVLPRGSLRKELLSCLRREHAYRRKHGERQRRAAGSRIQDMISIEERPEEVADRTVPGHWEGDLIIGKEHQSQLGTLVERTTRTTLLVPLSGRDAATVRDGFAEAITNLPEELQQSLTYDQGKEMAEHRQFTDATDMTVYFAHPRSPWERGTNENTNGLIRDFFPKGTDFNNVSQDEVRHTQRLLNTRPRKVLNWQTPEEALQAVLR